MNISQDLSSLAVTQKTSKGRLYQESNSRTRSEFQRDKDRILHSSAFRRLKHKTQVFVSHEGDHYRTRLTHSLEVSQIARSICKVFNLNEDLAETLSLSHDIGHPPFGHAGEYALSKSMKNYGGFDHNDQAIRILHILEKKYFDFDGLNLTWETIEGLVKHNGPIKSQIPETIDVINSQFDLRLNEYASLEAQIASIADDIAYNNHDLDDGLRAGFFTYDEISRLPLVGNIINKFPSNYTQFEMQRINHEITRKTTSLMINDVINNTLKNIENLKIKNSQDVRICDHQLADFSLDMKNEVKTIKSFLSEKMYNHDKVLNMTKNANQIVSSLFDFLEQQDDIFLKSHLGTSFTNNEKPRAISDFISGMTDNYAQSFYTNHVK
jgi:dGTPase